MKKSFLGLVVVLFLAAVPVSAGPVTALWDWSAIIGSNTYNPPALPGSVDDSGFDYGTGMGKLVFTVTGAGSHTVGVYLDLFIDEGVFNQFNEQGDIMGALPAGMSYQLDDPSTPMNPADPLDPILNPARLWTNFKNNALDNTNHVPFASDPPTACCDVALGLIFNFNLNAGDTAKVSFLVSGNAPTGFALTQWDKDDNSTIYISGSKVIGGGPIIPEPSTWSLMLLAGGVLLTGRVMRRK